MSPEELMSGLEKEEEEEEDKCLALLGSGGRGSSSLGVGASVIMVTTAVLEVEVDGMCSGVGEWLISSAYGRWGVKMVLLTSKKKPTHLADAISGRFLELS